MSDDFEFTDTPDPNDFEYGDSFDLKPKRDDPRKRKGRSFDWIDVWKRAVTQPEVGIYREHLADPQASLKRGLIWMLAASIIGTVLQAIALYMSSRGGIGMSGYDALDVNFSLMSSLCCAPFAAVLGVIVFIVWNGIQYLVAILLGGDGSFEDQAYIVASYAAPISLIGTAAGMIPCLGPLVAIGVGLYALYLNVVALETVHGFGRGKALIASLWWVPMLCLCLIGLIAMLVIAGVAISQDGLQDIINEFITPTPTQTPSVIWSSLRVWLR